ncbi:MAG: 16S rRNA (uracil(1498)-N(3))-methyltransferase [Candidatus Omnitrophica bacterium]|nr:16S rRNA (uracil(1498)-N(3))-methyltransferase [Candidatus Omnitrophota bacterium]
MGEKKALRLFYTDPANVYEDELYITGKEVHHMQHVLRLPLGERCEAFDGIGSTYTIEIAEYISPYRVKARIIEKRQEKEKPPVQITVAQAIPQKKVFDRIVEKATELGIQSIIPLLTDRTSNKLSGERSQSVVERWKTVSIQAAKQSRQATLPDIEAPQSLYDIIDRHAQYDFLLMPFPGEAVTINEVISMIQEARQDSSSPISILLLIGPEGGFTPQERDSIKAHDGITFSLGKNILKTDTAMIGCVTVLKQCL